MEIEFYDTYATSEKGIKIHFDVMLGLNLNIYEVVKILEK